MFENMFVFVTFLPLESQTRYCNENKDQGTGDSGTLHKYNDERQADRHAERLTERRTN